MITALLILWSAWVVINVAILLLAPLIWRDAPTAFTNGFAIVVPENFRKALTDDELAAIVEHERGHIARRHTLKNLFLRCLFIPMTQKRLLRQECEADDYAAARINPEVLAGALRSVSTSDLDHYRAARMSRRAAQAE